MISPKKVLGLYNLNPENSVVIGSGILQALGIRASKDIDLVVTAQAFSMLKASGKFSSEINHGREIITSDRLEIGTDWVVLDKPFTYADLASESSVIDGVRYNSLDFLYRVKKSWLVNGSARDKDTADIKLIKDYLDRNS